MPAATISITVIWPSRLETFAGDRNRSFTICMITIRIKENAERLDEAVGALEPRGEASFARLPAGPGSGKRSHAAIA